MKILLVGMCLMQLINVGYPEEDLYKVLGVKKSATSKEIKKAYKQLAKEW